MSSGKRHNDDTAPGNEEADGDLTDMLGELRVLLPGTQMLTAFLVILPFQQGFVEIREAEKLVYIITFVCAVVSLACFIAPAAQHRLQRPLRDRNAFKNRASRLMVIGLVPLSVTIILSVQLVVSTVFTPLWVSIGIAALIATVILALWWLVPLRLRGIG